LWHTAVKMDRLIVLAGIFGTAYVVGFSGAMMPGPLLAVTINESTRRGAIAGPLLMLGHMALEAALVAAVALGLSSVLKNPVVIGCVAFMGGGVMCWMGQAMVRSARHTTLRDAAGQRSRMHPVLAGALVSLSNPYWTIWWATIGITYVIMGLRFGLTGVIVFFAGHILSDFTWYTAVSVSVAQGGRLLSDRVYRAMIVACGATLVGFGAWFVWTGISTLRTGAVAS